MLAALERLARAQRQLVADASHELRTPLTSLRTNVEVLAARADLAPADRERLRARPRRPARGADAARRRPRRPRARRASRPPSRRRTCASTQLVAAAVRARAAPRAGDARFALDARAGAGRAASPARLDRAVANLLDNAAKWSPPGAPVEVRLRGGELTVRDHGPGIAEDDLPHVFDRFYRADAGARAARLRPRAGDRAAGGRGARRDASRAEAAAGRRRAAAAARCRPLSRSPRFGCRRSHARPRLSCRV